MLCSAASFTSDNTTCYTILVYLTFIDMVFRSLSYRVFYDGRGVELEGLKNISEKYKSYRAFSDAISSFSKNTFCLKNTRDHARSFFSYVSRDNRHYLLLSGVVTCLV